VPHLQLQVTHGDLITLIQFDIDFAPRHRYFDILSLDEGISDDLVAGLKRLDSHRVRGDFGSEQFLCSCESLGMVRVGMRRDDHLAGVQRKVHLAHHLDDFWHCFEIADVNEYVFAASVDQIDVASDAPAGLQVHLDDTLVVKDITAFHHRRGDS
jgi:hypothetical protein